MKKSLSKRTRSGICAFVALSLVMLSSTFVRAEGEEDKPTASLYADILSQYVWRGFGLSKTGAIIQPSMTASYKGFSLNVWGNFDTNARPPGSPPPYTGATWNETDFTFSYSHTIVGDLSGTLGGINYAYDSAPDSFEIYGGLSYAFPWLTVAVTGYREVSHYPGWFVQFDLSRNFKLPWYDMSTDLGMTFFYLSSSDSSAYPADFDNQGQPVDNGSAFSGMLSGQLAAALNIPIGKYVTVSPRIGYAFPLSGNATNLIRYVSWDGVQNHIFGGLRIAAAF
jgi:hypothetical protein